jgi:hypothetical protein
MFNSKACQRYTPIGADILITDEFQLTVDLINHNLGAALMQPQPNTMPKNG